MNYNKDFFEPMKQAKTIEERNNLFDDCIDTLLWEIERQPTHEKSQSKFDAIFLDLMQFWFESKLKEENYFDGIRSEIDIIVFGICEKCKRENIFLSAKIIDLYFIQGIFLDEVIKETMVSDTDEQVMRAKQSILSDILPPIQQIEPPELILHEWQKIDPLPIMPDNLREKEDFARAVFYYAEKDHYLKLENNRYAKDNISKALLAYMCILILYYGDKKEEEYLQMNLPKPDNFSTYFFGTNKAQNGYILNKARFDIVTDYKSRESEGKDLKPKRAEDIERIVKKAYNELHPQNA